MQLAAGIVSVLKSHLLVDTVFLGTLEFDFFLFIYKSNTNVLSNMMAVHIGFMTEMTFLAWHSTQMEKLVPVLVDQGLQNILSVFRQQVVKL